MKNRYLVSTASIKFNNKKEIFDQIEKNHDVNLPKNLVEQEISIIAKNLNSDEKINIEKKMKKLQNLE